MICEHCGYRMSDGLRLCPKCMKPTKNFKPAINYTHKEKKERGFSDEEILALGLHPDDEGYKMSLISWILGGK
ncbi:MAG: hypothetical protein NC079_02450 [Clostridium sp.]|nr:hypothetical protein [Acetatifactor muris]MCM1527225.1 hypothetical protein [Bacteroides sp.]MCM1562450.1 hypothetical protein [Clostridium sp.]